LPYQAQGAAMAVEDGAIIGTLLGLYQQANSTLQQHLTLADTLKLYESLQKARTTTLHLGSISNQYLYHIGDGAEQEERDRILKAAQWKERPEGESEPFIWIDVRYQKAILARDAIGDAKKKWEEVIQDFSGVESL
jgi:salicylate hydroxylase